MFIINQTFNVEQEILNEWIDWMKLVYIPEVMASGFFLQHKILKVLSEDIMNGHTFAVQFLVSDPIFIEMADENFINKYEVLTSKTFGDKVMFFRTLLEEI